MFNIKKSVIAAATIAAVGAGGLGISSAFAAHTSGGNNPRAEARESLIEAIATRFGINADEVRAVFEEEREARQEEREVHEAERLAQAVEDGKITQEQADAIAAHREEMEGFKESLKDLSADERHEAVKEKMEEVKAWAQENNIPREFLPHQNHGHHFSPRGSHGQDPQK
jgi:hypothetical protein